MSVRYRIDAMVVGVEKGGTTSLGAYLAEHPDVLSHLGSEVGDDRIEFPGFVAGASHDRDAFRRDFLEFFGREADPAETVVGKSVGIMHRPGAAEALQRHNPDCRLVASLRNPVDRAYSSFWYQRYRGTEDAPTFEAALERERERAAEGVHDPDREYLGKGRYVEHLERLTGMFGRDRLHVLLLEDLKERPGAAVSEVFEFLELEPMDVDQDIVKNTARRPRWTFLARVLQREGMARDTFRALVPRRARRRLWGWLRRMNAEETRPPPMDDATRRRLVEHFRPYNRRLEAFLGRELGHWNR